MRKIKAKPRSNNAPSAVVQPTARRDRAEEFLRLNAASINKQGIADLTGRDPSQPDWSNCEALAYLASRGLLTDKEQADFVQLCWQAEDYVYRCLPAIGSGINIEKPAAFWSDYEHWTCTNAAAATILRTITNCGLNDPFFDQWCKSWADDPELFGKQPCGVSEPSLTDLFKLCRSDLAIELAGIALEDAFSEFCAYRSEQGKFVWASPQLSGDKRVNARAAAMMLFIARRLKAPLFLDDMARHALGAVVTEQQANGSWLAATDDSARPSVITTAITIHALILWHPAGWEERVARAVAWLESRQNSDGSWREHEFNNCYTTVLVRDAVDLAAGKSRVTFSLDHAEHNTPTLQIDTGKLHLTTSDNGRTEFGCIAAAPAELDGPCDPYTWMREGQRLAGKSLQPATWNLLVLLWRKPGRTATYDDLGEPVFRDHARTLDKCQVEKQRTLANKFFRAHSIPWQVSVVDRDQRVFLKAAEVPHHAVQSATILTRVLKGLS